MSPPHTLVTAKEGSDVATNSGSGRQQTRRSRPRKATQPRGEARRREILDVAVRLFSAGGYNRVSLAEIAAEVGITQAGILHYFPSKAAVLLAVLDERDQRNAEEAARSRQGGRDALQAYIGTLAHNELDPEIVRLFVVLSAESAAPDHPGHDWFAERDEKVLANMVEHVEATLDTDRLPDGIDSLVIARWLLALPVGLGAQWTRNPESFARSEHVQLFLRLLEPYYRTRPSTSD